LSPAFKLAMPGDVKVQLSHVVPDMETRRVYLRTRQDGEPEMHMGESIQVDTTIHNGRGKGLRLDEAGFELVQHSTALSTEDFYEPTHVSARYYEEMKALFTKVTGSPHVVVFHHQVRNAEPDKERVGQDGSINVNTPVQPYAYGIHTDSSAPHAESLFPLMSAQMPEERRRGRFLYINAWRNIADVPIEDDHLAVLDERSVVKPDDYIPQKLHGMGFEVLQYVLSARHTAQHRWYYYPRMEKDEVLVFKQWDSNPELQGRVCFHTAFSDPAAPAGAPKRQSIEVRAFVFFPDHEPNTCPPIQPRRMVENGDCDGDCDEELAKSCAGKLLYAIPYIESNPSVKMLVLASMKSKYASGGARAVVAEFAEDRQGSMGCREASVATKARVVELAMGLGVGKQVDVFFSNNSACKEALSTVLRSRLSAGVFGVALGVAVATLAARRHV